MLCNEQTVYVIRERRLVDDLFFRRKHRNGLQKRNSKMGTGASSSRKHRLSSHAVDETANDKIIKELQAEIERLKAESGKGSKRQRLHH